MLTPSPATLRNLVDEYEAALAGAAGDPVAHQRAEDLAYTLCVSTGTREVRLALESARRRLGAAQGAAAAAVGSTPVPAASVPTTSIRPPADAAPSAVGQVPVARAGGAGSGAALCGDAPQ
ncbi:hypothetical protein GCM10010358_49210 [Streptomyces minutiscleroticus]|uniref:DUF5133 domain-containing protein n=1 Tax=Streptomyces minutiscleroticus TaxID=68238 RepID=A0A918U429_9ACTN|nr:DUF5133 domain-containing protein [Streptomyces minutiscleroticus]GGX89426.1 hypothetical protein GCM10010358_49210 [Streptomyces minutiscleroticus]